MIRETLFVAIPIGLLGYILKFLGFAINIVEYSPNNHILNYQSKLFGYILNYFTVINYEADPTLRFASGGVSSIT